MALIKEGLLIERDIKISLSEQGGGNVYMIGKKRNIAHQASAPGEAPAVLTGRLRASITTAWTDGQRPTPDGKAEKEDAVGIPGGSMRDFRVVVGTNVDYAVFLELGTSKMAPRPFMRPALERHAANIESNLGSIILQIPMELAMQMQQEIGGEFGSD